MRRTIVVGVTLLVGCFSGFTAREIVAPARAQGQVAPPYEYDVVHVANSVDNDKAAATAKNGLDSDQHGQALVAGDTAKDAKKGDAMIEDAKQDAAAIVTSRAADSPS